MRDEIERRDALRLRLLRSIYEASGGSGARAFDMAALAPHLGAELEDVMEAARYLVGENLLRWLGGRTAFLTHAGIVEVEAAIRNPDQATDHFSVTVINQTSHGPVATGVQTGGTSQVAQNVGAPLGDVAALIEAVRAALPESAAEAREALKDVQEELAAAHPKPSRLKAFGAALWSATQNLLTVAPKVVELLDKLGVHRK